MDQLYLGYTGWEYLFMTTWTALSILIVYCYVRVQDLKDELQYRRYLTDIMTRKS